MAEDRCGAGDADEFGKAGTVVDYGGAESAGGGLDGGCAEFREDCEVDESTFFFFDSSNQIGIGERCKSHECLGHATGC